MKLALSPVGDAMTELARLDQAEEKARARIAQVSTDERAAYQERDQAREALVQLEAGEPAAQDRAAAEKRLAQAEQATQARWPERRAGAERAAREAHHALVRHATLHLDELVAEVEEAGAAAAEQVDACAKQFLDAVARVHEVERTLTSLVALTRRMQPGEISRSRADQARMAVCALLDAGGEAPPVLLARTRGPQTVEEAVSA